MLVSLHRSTALLKVVVSLVSLLHLTQADFEPVSQPELKFSLFGGQLGLFGSFDALSLYSFVNASQFLDPEINTQKSTQSQNSDNLFLRDLSNNNNAKLANVDGTISQILPLSDQTIIVSGNFTTFNNQSITSPIIYNVTSQQITNIIPSTTGNSKRADIPSFENGQVKTVYVDGDLIYLGGDFEFNNTVGAAIYNQTSKQLYSTHFGGFGSNASVNAITKIFSTNADDDSGSILFGGDFNTLGLSDLLVHNITSNSTRSKNATNTSLITAEQMISLRHGTFTNVNGAVGEDGSSIICSADQDTFSFVPAQGGQWLVELADEMKPLTPTKARLYIPPGDDGVKLFRIYSFPNNGIMNLSYIDPETNSIAFCDAWCPLSTLTSLGDAVESNIAKSRDISNSSTFVDPVDGTFFQYYDLSTKSKTLGYGSDFQEFAFVDEIGVDQVGVTVIDWYGSKAVLGGFELYSNSITVYGNNTLNEPNCDDEDAGNLSEINAGEFQSVKDLVPNVANTNYLVAQGEDAKITLYPNISYAGNYSIIMTTPGCTYDDSCNQRSIVNVTLIDNMDTILATNLIWQNNNNNKFDYLFYGHLNGSSSSNGRNRIEITFHDTIGEGTTDPWVVVDKITANIVGLDKYYDQSLKNSTNSTVGSELAYIHLNGLFEYSLANFTNFNASKVSYKSGDNSTIISKENTFVGNSSINLLSGELVKGSIVNQFTIENSSDSSSLLLLGQFESDSTNITLTNSNVITLNLNAYNSTSNQTEVNKISKRDLFKRADSSMTIYGVDFNSSVSSLFNYEGGIFLLGDFAATQAGNSSITMKNLANNNSSITTINNIAYRLENDWFGFGNNFTDTKFDLFTNVTIQDTQYFVFSNGSTFKTWDHTNSKWVTDPQHQLNISHALNLNSRMQILGGESFNVMDFYSRNQAYIHSPSNFSNYNFEVSSDSLEISNSFYVNSSLSVIGGRFNTLSVSNIGFIDNSASNSSIRALGGNIEWQNASTSIQMLYVDSNEEFLFIGVNGSVVVNDGVSITGIVIYDLKNNTFTDFQPADLSNDDGSSIEVNSIVHYEKSNRLLVGGNFDKAGSLDCPGLCIYDIANTRWINPEGQGVTTSIGGVATDIKFYKSNEVLVSGNLTISSNSVNFITYNFDKGTYSTQAALNDLGSSKVIKRFIINDYSNNDLKARLVAFGDDFVYGYDGSNWHQIDDDINFDNSTTFSDLKLLDLKNKNGQYNSTLFSQGNILALAGAYSLKDYGLVNVALYNGSQWIPYVYTTSGANQLGQVKTMLIDDSYRFQSSDDISSVKHLSKGKVVGISLACALGSTTILGLLYVIPYFLLFRKQRDEEVLHQQRIEEDQMMKTVNPTELIHEIDLQRHS